MEQKMATDIMLPPDIVYKNDPKEESKTKQEKITRIKDCKVRPTSIIKIENSQSTKTSQKNNSTTQKSLKYIKRTSMKAWSII